MKHLYLIAFVLIALTNANRSTAQMVNTTNPATPISCDGTAFFTLHNSYTPPFWSWHWEDGTTQIAGADSLLTNLCAGNYSLVLDSLGIPVYSEPFTITDQCSYFSCTLSFTNCTAGNCDGSISYFNYNGANPVSWEWSTIPGTVVGFGTLNNLCPGTYSVTCTEAGGCDVSATVTITGVPASPLAANVTHTNDNAFTCSGTATAAPTGGFGPYSYDWNTGETTSSISNLCGGTYSVLITDAVQNTVSANFTVTDPCSNFTVSTSVTNANVGYNNGSIQILVNGGIAPYLFSLNGAPMPSSNILGLFSGTYDVYVTDGIGCSVATTAVVLDIYPPIIPNLTSTNDPTNSCNGSASVVPTGGAGGYSFIWSSGQTTSSITNLCAGTYSVTITDTATTTVTASVTITNACSNLTLSASVTNPTSGNCDGAIQATVSGGTGPYAFSLSGAPQTGQSFFSNLCPGTYTINVVDPNGCSANATATVTDPCTNFTSTLSSTNSANSAACDGTITFNAIGGTAPFTYEFDNAFNQSSNFFDSICAGSHMIICFDANGCIRVETTIIINLGSAPILPNVTTTNDNMFNCSGTASATPTGGAGSYSYLWSTGETTSSISGLCAGAYSVTIQDANQDTASFYFTITNPCSNINLSATTTNCTAGNCDGTLQFTVTGASGSYTYTVSGGVQMGQLPIPNLCPGSYTVTVVDANGCSATATAIVIDSSQQNPIVPNLTSTDDLSGVCLGSASASPTGGSGSYNYLWSNGATTSSIDTLCDGTYSVTIWDATDTVTVSFTITNPCLSFYGVLATTPSIDGNCDGTITSSVSGGTAPYSYLWSNGVTTANLSNLCTDSYLLTCQDINGCIFTETISVIDSNTVVSNISANLTSTDDLTNNCSGSASVSPTGGIPPYTISWGNGQSGNSASNLCAGIYTVTISDAADSTTVSFVIADSSSTYSNNPYPNGPINDTLYTDLETNCIIDYNTIDSASLYQAVYNSSTQSLYVTWAVYSPTDTVYISDTLALIGNPGYYNLTISVYCPNKSGNDFFKIEQVVYFDGTTVWTSTLGLDEQHLLDNITIYPNPFNNSISVDNKNGVIRSVKLVDLNGRVISEMSNLNSGLVQLNQLEAISSGTYLLILSGDSASKTYKVIK